MKYCCESMDYHLEKFFNTPDEMDNPDAIIKYVPKFDEYGIPIYDGGTSMIEIRYCPWCGTKLPDSKRDLWFDSLEKKRIKIDLENEIPEEYKSSKWYRK